MQTVRREQINDLADNVRNACNVRIPATEDELIKMIRLLGGVYELRANYEYEASIQKTGEASFKIVISEEYMPTRRKFSIAHEIGHLFLHMGFLINETKWQNRDNAQLFRDSARDRLGRSEAESEANEFAGALLMPRKEFEEIALQKVVQVDGNDFYQVDQIAEYFDVSLQAALTRGRWLKIFPWE